jgi:hypothetical protein
MKYVAVHGMEWALRLAIGETSQPEPKGIVLLKGCNRCAGYGMPGWMILGINDLRWEKCSCWSENKEHWPFCKKCGEYTTANTSGICNFCLNGV